MNGKIILRCVISTFLFRIVTKTNYNCAKFNQLHCVTQGGKLPIVKTNFSILTKYHLFFQEVDICKRSEKRLPINKSIEKKMKKEIF